MNAAEWKNYSEQFSERDSQLLKRTYETLMNNVYTEGGFLWSPYRCVTPGKGVFPGIWNWDSAFHAVGLSRWDTELAKESIMGFLQFQRENGIIPDLVYETDEVIDTYCKPPVFAWATEIVYKRDKDIEFVKQVYPKLCLNEQFWCDKRSYEGLFYYDADNKEADDYITRVRYESGWDNSVRWDDGITEYWAIDLNCFMVMFYRSLSYLANELGIMEDKKKWDEKEKELVKLINEKMWDSENKYYADANRFTGEVSSALSPASFMPLFIQIASNERAADMAIVAERDFKEKMPTVPFDSPAYSHDYWRGPTWLNVAYFAAKGLKNYDLPVADKIKENILNMCYNEKRGIYENYDAVTGEGLYCDHFSWSCVFINEFILNFENKGGY